MRPTIQAGLSELIKLPRRCSRLFVSELIALIVIFGSDIGTAGVTPVSPTKPPQRVLVLYSDERLLPANIILDESIRADLRGSARKAASSFIANSSTPRVFPVKSKSSGNGITCWGNTGSAAPTC